MMIFEDGFDGEAGSELAEASEASRGLGNSALAVFSENDKELVNWEKDWKNDKRWLNTE